MLNLVLLGVAGALGSVSRYLLGGWIHQLLGPQFPYGTFVVNAVGCLAIGFLGTLADERFLLGSQLRGIILLGFLGAFTTFSSFAYETWALTKEGEMLLAGLNVLGTLFVCFVGLIVGVLIARLL